MRLSLTGFLALATVVNSTRTAAEGPVEQVSICPATLYLPGATLTSGQRTPLVLEVRNTTARLWRVSDHPSYEARVERPRFTRREHVRIQRLAAEPDGVLRPHVRLTLPPDAMDRIPGASGRFDETVRELTPGASMLLKLWLPANGLATGRCQIQVVLRDGERVVAESPTQKVEVIAPEGDDNDPGR